MVTKNVCHECAPKADSTLAKMLLANCPMISSPDEIPLSTSIQATCVENPSKVLQESASDMEVPGDCVPAESSLGSDGWELRLERYPHDIPMVGFPYHETTIVLMD